MRDFLIKNKAFELPPVAEVSPRRLSKYLQSLYGHYVSPCYDFYMPAYQQQMGNLVDRFYQMAEHDDRLDPELAWRVKENFSSIQYPSGTLQERRRYFVEIKENLEQILFLIKDHY